MGRREFDYERSTWALYAESSGLKLWRWWVELVLPEEERIVCEPQEFFPTASEKRQDLGSLWEYSAGAETQQERAVLSEAEKWVRYNAPRVLREHKATVHV